MITLYGTALSRASRCLWMLEETELPYEHVPTRVSEDGTRSDWFTAMNPNARIPVLKDGDFVLWESFAINLHLASRHRTSMSMQSGREEAAALVWSFWAATEFEPDAHLVYQNTLARPEASRDQAELGCAAERLQRPLAALARSLETNGWLAADRFSVADLNVACVAFYLRGSPGILAAHSQISDWYARASGRPAFSRMLQLREAAADHAA